MSDESRGALLLTPQLVPSAVKKKKMILQNHKVAQPSVEEVEIIVPDGVSAGEELIVTAPEDGAELIVVIPPGNGPGDKLVVTMPDGANQDEQLVVVTIPLGVTAGQDMLVEAPDGRQLLVTIPLGLQPGDSMDVSIPRLHLAALQPDRSPQGSPAWPPRLSLPSAPTQPAKPAELHTPHLPPPSPPSAPLPPAAPPAPAPATRSSAPPPPPLPAPPPASGGGRVAERLLAPELSDESDDEREEDGAKARFGVGSPVEVMRSDGLFTLATVVEYDTCGRSYTIRVSDGRLKHFVDEDELRVPKFLLLSTGEI